MTSRWPSSPSFSFNSVITFCKPTVTEPLPQADMFPAAAWLDAAPKLSAVAVTALLARAAASRAFMLRGCP